MSCYHPLVMIEHLDMSDPKLRAFAEQRKIETKYDRHKFKTHTFIPVELAEKAGIHLRKDKALIVPCGRCIGCRLDYSRIWAERCVHEAEQYDHNYFLTLTYDDAHLPVGKHGNATLVKDEITLFMKKLRNRFADLGHTGVRFFACGEYGDGTPQRPFNPHFHIILFNAPFNDFQDRHPVMKDGRLCWLHLKDKDENLLKFSPMVADCWKDDKGFLKGSCTLGDVTFESCAYVARYVVKKQYGENSKIYDELGIFPEFVRMSRMPGIGAKWYEDHLEHIYQFDNLSFKRGDKVINQKPGKYFDKLVQKHLGDQAYYDRKKERHEQFYDSIDLLDFNGHDLAEQNHRKEEAKEAQARMLMRTL